MRESEGAFIRVVDSISCAVFMRAGNDLENQSCVCRAVHEERNFSLDRVGFFRESDFNKAKKETENGWENEIY